MKYVLYVIFGLPALFLVLHTTIRTIRHFHKFPMPEFLANLIDNPLRRRIQPPDKMPIRHGIAPGMTVLEVGPGNGRYSIETARRVGVRCRIISIRSQMYHFVNDLIFGRFFNFLIDTRNICI